MINSLMMIPFWYMLWVLSGTIVLAISSIVNLGNGFFYDILHILSFVISYLWFKKFRSNFNLVIKKNLWELLLFLIFLFPTIFRFPVYYPLYDDLSFHIQAGAYAGSYWFDKNFMPMSFLNYLYPLAQVIYYPFMNWLGMRLTLLLTSGVMAIWFFTLVMRFSALSIFKGFKKYILQIICIYIFFYPYLLTTQVSFSVDFIALLFALEAFYVYLSGKKKNYTLLLVLLITSFFLKESTGIFLVPMSIFIFFKIWKEKINWSLVSIILGLITVYIIRSYINTGNPIGFLYNNIFKSPFYPLNNFRDSLFGAMNIKDIFLWPFIGPFTERFGQGWVPEYLKIFFGLFLPLPLIVSLYFIIKKKLYFIVIPLTYYLWSIISGYSRYLIPFTSIFWLWLFKEIKIPDINLRNLYVKTGFIIMFLIFVIVSVTSIQTDYGWRPYPFARVYGQLSGSVSYYTAVYKNGLKLIGKDKPMEMAKRYRKDFLGYDVVVPFLRGQVAYYAYLGYLNGLTVIDAVDNETYNRVINSKLMNKRLSENLIQINSANKILFVFEKNHEEYAKNTYVYKKFNCMKLGNAPAAEEFQGNYYFEQIERYLCLKK